MLQGRISKSPLLCAPLINYNSSGKPVVNTDSFEEIKEILAVQKLANPIIKNFATMLERPNPHNGVPVLTSSDVQHIVRKAIERDTRGLSADELPNHMGIAFELPNPVHGRRPQDNTRAANATPIHVGEAHRRTEATSSSGHGNATEFLTFF